MQIKSSGPPHNNLSSKLQIAPEFNRTSNTPTNVLRVFKRAISEVLCVPYMSKLKIQLQKKTGDACASPEF